MLLWTETLSPDVSLTFSSISNIGCELIAPWLLSTLAKDTAWVRLAQLALEVALSLLARGSIGNLLILSPRSLWEDFFLLLVYIWWGDDINLELWLNFSINKPPVSVRRDLLTINKWRTVVTTVTGAASPAAVCADGTEPGDI